MTVGIHPVHRKLAEIAHMCTDKQGNMVMGLAELRLMMPLLRQNMLLVQKLDELKQLAYAAQIGGDMVWVQEICRKIDQLEASMI